MSKKKYFKIIVMSVVIIFAIISSTIFLKSKETYSLKQQEYTMGNTSGNIINKGLTAYQNGYIYYSNTSDKKKLYRMKEDGSSKKKISDDSCSYINVIGDWIYYRNDDDLGKIYKIKTDGTIRTCLNKDDSKFVIAAGDYIYYCNSSNNNQITRIKNDGSEWKVICKDSAEFTNISNGWIYYSNTSENYSIYRININGKKRTLLSKDSCYFLNVSGDWIYYSNYSKGCKLCKIKINGRNNTILDSTSSENINVYGDWIFFIDDFDRNMLYKVKLDGTMKQNNDGITSVISVYDLNNALLGNIPYEIKDDKLKKAYEKAKEIVKELIKPGMTDLEKELILHNYVVTHSRYDIDGYKNNNKVLNAGNAYGILVNGIGVCAGYAEAMQLVLNLSGVECKYIVGKANGLHGYERHAWNIVKIDGEYYHLDATWNDPPPDMGNHLTLKYFNLSDNAIKNDHICENSHYKACTSDRFSYLRDMDFPVYQDGWIYYSSISDGYRLYKMRIDGTNKEKLSNDYAKYILVDGKYIYFSNYSKCGHLYKIDINGKDGKQLNSENCKTIGIENGILKYSNDTGCTKTIKIR